MKLPDFQSEFPDVISAVKPNKLPPLRPGLNHTIPIDDAKKDGFRNEFRAIPMHKLNSLQQWLNQWEEAGIAERGPAKYAAVMAWPRSPPLPR